MFEDDEMRVLASLSDCLTDVATLSRAVGRQVLLGSLNAFELINEPALSMSGSGLVIEMNRAATDVFDADFRVRNNRLYMRDGKASQALERMLWERPDSEIRLVSRARAGNVIVGNQEAGTHQSAAGPRDRQQPFPRRSSYPGSSRPRRHAATASGHSIGSVLPNPRGGQSCFVGCGRLIARGDRTGAAGVARNGAESYQGDLRENRHPPAERARRAGLPDPRLILGASHYSPRDIGAI
jgi:hypothetical protein